LLSLGDLGWIQITNYAGVASTMIWIILTTARLVAEQTDARLVY
jgi:hypothetical protein